MIGTIHALAGWQLGKGRSSLMAAFLIGIFSHAALDLIPHVDPVNFTDQKGLDWYVFLFADALLPWMLIWVFTARPPWRERIYFACALGAYLPDVLLIVSDHPETWGFEFITRTRPIELVNAWHHATHFWRDYFPMPKYWRLGLATQLGVLAVLALVQAARVYRSWNPLPAPNPPIAT